MRTSRLLTPAVKGCSVVLSVQRFGSIPSSSISAWEKASCWETGYSRDSNAYAGYCRSPIFRIRGTIPSRIVQKNLVLLDIAEFVEATATSEDCSNGKPAPDVFLLAAKKLGVEPENCLVVEDAGNGLLGARRAGMTCAGFEGSELPSDTALAPVTFSDYRKVTVEDLRKWHLEQSVK